jgi:hypothetical protein
LKTGVHILLNLEPKKATQRNGFEQKANPLVLLEYPLLFVESDPFWLH